MLSFLNVFDFLSSIGDNSCWYIDFRIELRFENTMSEKTGFEMTGNGNTVFLKTGCENTWCENTTRV